MRLTSWLAFCSLLPSFTLSPHTFLLLAHQPHCVRVPTSLLDENATLPLCKRQKIEEPFFSSILSFPVSVWIRRTSSDILAGHSYFTGHFSVILTGYHIHTNIFRTRWTHFGQSFSDKVGHTEHVIALAPSFP